MGWTASSLALFQCLLFAGISLAFHIPVLLVTTFIPITLVYHAGLFLGMLRLRSLFVFAKTNEPLHSINLSNILSLFRLSSIPTILFVVMAGRDVYVTSFAVPFLSIVFLTDLLDGIIARRWKQVTLIGKYLDATSDYLILFATSLIFLWYQLLPLWFFVVLLVRLLVVVAGHGIHLLRFGSVRPQTTYLGKASVFSVMVLFAVIVFKLSLEAWGVPFPGRDALLSFAEKMPYMVAGVIIVGTIEKIDPRNYFDRSEPKE
jgi:phosphatidylglycerophosphate synthase